MGLGVSSIWIGFSVMDNEVSDPPSVDPDLVVSVSTNPVELKLIGLGVSPVDVAAVGDSDIVGEISVEAVVFSVVEREIGVPTGFETFSPPVLAVVLVVALLGIGFGVSPVREGPLVVPMLDVASVGWVIEVTGEDVLVFIGFCVSSIVGFALMSLVVSGTSVVTFEV